MVVFLLSQKMLFKLFWFFWLFSKIQCIKSIYCYYNGREYEKECLKLRYITNNVTEYFKDGDAKQHNNQKMKDTL